MSYRYRNDLPAELVRSLLDYNPETGVFYWRQDRSIKVRAGDRAGSIRSDGYIHFRINGTRYLAHRLVWLWMVGEWRREEVDHVNLVRDDNRWGNLREATHAENSVNRPPREKLSGLPPGVHFIGSKRKFRAVIAGMHLGTFATPEEAAEVYATAAKDFYGEFYRGNE